MANFAPLVGEALPAYGLPRPAFPYEEGDANKSTPGMKWLPINYARPAKCNDFLTLRGAGEPLERPGHRNARDGRGQLPQVENMVAQARDDLMLARLAV